MSSDFKDGSTRELWRVSYPMMVSFFSMMFMIFVDRLFLSWYSTHSLNACVQAGTLAWGIILGWLTMASMSEVFVAQFNGAKRYNEIGVPVWQMFWFTLASFIFYIPMAIWGTSVIYNPLTRSEEYLYLQMLMFFGPFFAFVPAIGGFFIGRGKTQIMQWMAILGNIVNIILDPIFIFGIKGVIPSMGVTGAALATGLGNVIQMAILLALFVKREHREKYGVTKFAFNSEIFYKTFKVGLPPAIFVGLEVLGWAAFYHLMSTISPKHIFIASVCQTIVLLFFFFGMGLEKGAIALSGNFMGAGEHSKVHNVLISGLKLIGIYGGILIFFLVLFPEPLINWFISTETHQISELGEIKGLIKIGLLISAFYIIFENIRWVLNGILTAAGDTLFLLIAGVINVWFLLLVPTYFFVVLPEASIFYAFVIWLVYGVIAAAVVYARFLLGKWKKKEILNKEIV